MDLLQTVNMAVVGAVGVILGAVVHGLRAELTSLHQTSLRSPWPWKRGLEPTMTADVVPLHRQVMSHR